MVLGFILYESIDLVYNVGKLSYNAITGTYNWYYGIQSAEIQERELEMTKIHELEAKIDHEECLSLGFKEETEAYGGCRLTLKSIRSQDKTTQAIRSNGLDDRFCRRWYYC